MAKRRTMKKRSMKRKTMKRRQRGGENMFPPAANMSGSNMTNTKKNNKGILNTITSTVANVTGLGSNSGTQAGGKKKTRKPSPWAKGVGKLYHEMQRKDKKATFVDALKEASRLKKTGKFKY